MTLSEELAYTTVADLAGRIRRRELSPVEVLDATIARIEARNPSLNALVHLDFDEAREAAREAERALTGGGELGPLHGVPAAIKDLFDFKPGWPSTFGGIRALRDFKPDIFCAFAERAEAAGAILVGKGNAPVMGFCGATRQPAVRPEPQPVRHDEEHGRLLRRLLGGGRRRTAHRSPRAPTAAARSASRPRGAGSTATSPRSDACLTSRARTRSAALTRSCSRAPSPARSRTPRSC